MQNNEEFYRKKIQELEITCAVLLACYQSDVHFLSTELKSVYTSLNMQTKKDNALLAQENKLLRCSKNVKYDMAYHEAFEKQVCFHLN